MLYNWNSPDPPHREASVTGCEGEVKPILHIQLLENQNIITECEEVKDKMEKTRLTGKETAKTSGFRRKDILPERPFTISWKITSRKELSFTHYVKENILNSKNIWDTYSAQSSP